MSTENLIPMFKEQCEVSQSSSTYNAYDIYLDEDIKEPTYYRQAFQVLRSAQHGDLVRIYISSYGGNLNSAIIFKNSIEACEGDVIAIIEGEAYSAASLIALSCPGIEVKPYATMMCHSAAFGAGGSVQNVRDHVDFVGKHAESLMEEVYRDFLSPSDLEDLRRGREIWLNHEEIGDRLDKMFEARNAGGCDDPNCNECGVPEEDEESFSLEDVIDERVQLKVKELLDAHQKKLDNAAKRNAKKALKTIEEKEDAK